MAPSFSCLASAYVLFCAAGVEVGRDVPKVPGADVGNIVPKELPGPGFPGATAEQSNAAWPSGVQPTRFAAWPQTTESVQQSDGTITKQRKLLPCWKTTVLRDTRTGWPGACLNLFAVAEETTKESCRSYCMHEPLCPVWQFNNQTGGGCWAGYGVNCRTRQGHNDVVVAGSQRLQHGEVRVLMNMSSWQILGLFNVGVFSSGTEQEDVGRCRDFCYSDIGCQYWQYGTHGCWVDARYLQPAGTVPNEPQYPLTKAGGATDSTMFAKTIVAGEYIQHYCPPVHTTPTPFQAAAVPAYKGAATPAGVAADVTTEAPPEKTWPKWWLFGAVGLVIFALVVAGAAVCVFTRKKKGGTTRTRALSPMDDHMSAESNDLGDYHPVEPLDVAPPSAAAQAPEFGVTPPRLQRAQSYRTGVHIGTAPPSYSPQTVELSYKDYHRPVRPVSPASPSPGSHPGPGSRPSTLQSGQHMGVFMVPTTPSMAVPTANRHFSRWPTSVPRHA